MTEIQWILFRKNYEAYLGKRDAPEADFKKISIKYQGNGFDQLSVTGKTDDELLTGTDFDFTPMPIQGSGSMEYAANMFCQEFRFTSEIE